jgi:hypothetical protein
VECQSICFIAEVDPAIQSTMRTSSEATGIMGGTGTDRIVNNGDITVGADPDTHSFGARSDIVALDLGPNSPLNADDMVDASVTSTATATGIDGGDGRATRINSTVSVDSPLALAEVDGSAAALAEAWGIAAGAGSDTVKNSGTITAIADPLVIVAEVDLGVIGLLIATAAPRIWWSTTEPRRRCSRSSACVQPALFDLRSAGSCRF